MYASLAADDAWAKIAMPPRILMHSVQPVIKEIPHVYSNSLDYAFCMFLVGIVCYNFAVTHHNRYLNPYHLELSTQKRLAGLTNLE